ncbi:MAG: TonB-dependent receptor [Muribaculaceae bacterium]|nr:TonB-dependent receptor [Muribaculaceae bacterium]
MNKLEVKARTLLVTVAALVAIVLPLQYASASTNFAEAELDSATMLMDIEVTATRRPLATAQELEGAKLQSLSSTSIADALKYFAGVQIKDYGGLGGLKTINVRSLGAQHVGVYIDGIRITNAQNGTVDLGKYSLSTLESVSLYNANKLEKGQSASEYASGATVYLRTRRPDTDSLSVLAGIGSFHTYRGRLNLQFNRRGWQGFIDGEYLYSKGDYPFRYKSEYEDTVGRRKNSDIRFYRIEGALFHKGFAAHIYSYISERGCPGGIVRRLSDKYTNIGREWDTDIFVQASWQRAFNPAHFLSVNGKYSHEYLRYDTDYPENQNTARVNNHYFQNDAYLSAAYTFSPLRWLYVNVGYDARMSWLKADLRNFSSVRRLDQKAVVDAHFEWRGFRAQASVLYQHYKDHTKMKAGAADPISKFTPSFIIGYNWRGLNVRGWYKRIFRVPTLNDLYYTQAGNRNLKPEYTRQWNLGAEYTLTLGQWQASAQADAYINHIDNRIVCLPLRGTYTWSMMNYGKTFCRGLNATLSGQFNPGDWTFSLLGSLTLQHDVNRTNPEDEETYDIPICYSPKTSFGLTGIVAWRNFSLTISELHVGKRIWSYADPDDILAPYNNVDIKLSGQWRWFIASFEINDLFDVQYEHVPRYPMPGRNFKFTLTYTLGKT